jgi:uncharacterized protein (DUF1697 family)
VKVYVALFRGINVGGKNVLPMKVLVTALEELGARGIRTYIQSGNAVFQATEQDPSRLSSKIRREIGRRRGFEPQVLLLERGDIERTILKNPFPEAAADPKTLHAGFLASAPPKPDLKMLASLKTESERFRLLGKVFYLHAPDGIGRSKLAANAERLLGVSMTDRNWRTVCKIDELAKEMG